MKLEKITFFMLLAKSQGGDGQSGRGALPPPTLHSPKMMFMEKLLKGILSRFVDQDIVWN